MSPSGLGSLVEQELMQPVDPRVSALAEAIATHHGDAARAVLFYGSCLREQTLDGLMLDFYLIVSDYRAAYPQRWLATANRLVPPNVFPFAADDLAAKYAVLSEADFARLASSKTRNVSVWARFAQPSRLVWARDVAARERAIDAVSGAAPALLAAAWPTLDVPPSDPLDLWRRAFTLTYSAELRAERGGRPDAVVDTDPERYRAFTSPALVAAKIDPRQPASRKEQNDAARLWRFRRIQGKALTLTRLLKASLTFAGGIDYLAWKINRHAKAGIVIRPWQRRWPILGALTLLPRLWARGAVR
jgi:hypothetical protein